MQRDNEFTSQIRQYIEDNPFEAEAWLSESYADATELGDRMFPEDGRRLREEELAELEALEARAARNRPAPMLRPQEMPGARIPGNVHSTDMRGLYAGVQNLAAALVNRKRQRRMLGDPEALAEARKEREAVKGRLGELETRRTEALASSGAGEGMRGRTGAGAPAVNPREDGARLATMGVSMFGENSPRNRGNSAEARRLRERLGELDRRLQENRGVVPQLRELRTRQQQARMNAERRADFVSNAQEQLFDVRRDEASDRRSMFGDLIQEEARGQTAVTRIEAQGEQQRELEGMRQEGRAARDEQQFQNELEEIYIKFGLSQREADAEAERINNGGNPNTSVNYSMLRDFIRTTEAGVAFTTAKENLESLQQRVANARSKQEADSYEEDIERAEAAYAASAAAVNREWARQVPGLSELDVMQLPEEDDEDDASGLPDTVRNPNRDPAPADTSGTPTVPRDYLDDIFTID